MRLKLIIGTFTTMLSVQPALSSSDALNFFLLQNSPSTTQRDEKPAKQASSTAGRQSTLGLGSAAGEVGRLADQHGIPRNLALSVCNVESRCRYGMVGRAGERGPMQIKLQTARGLGYSGSASGLNGHAGAYWGVKHLAVAYRKCGTARGAAKLHNAGLASSCSGSGYASRVVAGL